jgi:RimJ/RimL family protein N-acetyltransferase
LKPTLTTARLTLRPHVAADLDVLVELDGDPEVRRYVDLAEPRTREEVHAWLRRWRICRAARAGGGLDVHGG